MNARLIASLLLASSVSLSAGYLQHDRSPLVRVEQSQEVDRTKLVPLKPSKEVRQRASKARTPVPTKSYTTVWHSVATGQVAAPAPVQQQPAIPQQVTIEQQVNTPYGVSTIPLVVPVNAGHTYQSAPRGSASYRLIERR